MCSAGSSSPPPAPSSGKGGPSPRSTARRAAPSARTASPTSSRERTCFRTSLRVENVAFAARLRPAQARAAPGSACSSSSGSREGRSPAGRAVGRRGATRCDRSRACAAAGAPALRRADRSSRLRHALPRVLDLIECSPGASIGSRSSSPPTTPTSPRASSVRLELEDGSIVARGGAMRIAAPLAIAELVRAPGRTALRVLDAGRCGRAARGDGPLRRALARDDDRSAVRSVPLDWQGPVASSHAAARRVAGGVARQPGVAEAAPVATAPFAGIEHVSPAAGTIRSGAGSILAVPPGYLAHIAHLPLPARLASARRDRPRPAARRDLAGAAGRHGDADAAAGREADHVPRQRDRARHRSGSALPAAQPAARPGSGPAAGRHRDPAVRDLRGQGRAALPSINSSAARRPSPARRAGRSGRCRRRSTRPR